MMAAEEETLATDSSKSEAAIEKLPGETAPNPLSKRQIKKQKKLAEYAIKKQERRQKEREKQKQKSLARRALGLPAQSGPTRKELKKRQANFNEHTSASVKVAIDLDYDDLMSERDIAKIVKQCLRIYTINRRSPKPGQLHLTGIKREGNIHNSFKRNDGWENWKITYHFDRTHRELFESDKIVYLTCESDTVLDKIEEDFVYVIGGLVDHNHHKGLCHERALRDGLKTARLPLSEHVNMKTRKVLSTFHVFELLLRVAGGSSWTDAILATIPLRKGAKPKADKDDDALEDSSEVEEESNVIESCAIKITS